MKSTSDIIDLMLQKCIELFEQEKQKADYDIKKYGEPPKTAIIIYGLGEMTEGGYLITGIRQKWIYENGCLKETDMKREVQLEPRSGMYYLEARFEFSFDADKDEAHLNIGYGPRYARGIRFELVQEENQVLLCNDKVLWVS